MSEPRAIWSRTIERIESESVRSARKDFSACLAGRGVGEPDLGAATMIFGELLANACEHGCAPVHVDLVESGSRFFLRVVDGGTGISRPTGGRAVDSIRGRGLEIIEKLGGMVQISPRPVSGVTVGLPFALEPGCTAS